jgi:hypothetical protein
MIKDVLIEMHGSSTLVDFLVMDMDPHQQTSIIFGVPLLKSVRAAINEKKGIINIKVEGKYKMFTLRPKTQHASIKFEFIIRGPQTRSSM